MQDPDPKCRHLGILWHFMAFHGIWAFLPKSQIRNQIRFFRVYPIFSNFQTFPDFQTFRFHNSSFNAPANVEIMIFVLTICCIITCANFISRKSLSDSSGHHSHRSCFDDFWKTLVLNQKFCSIKSSKMLVRGVDDVSISPQIENLSSW